VAKKNDLMALGVLFGVLLVCAGAACLAALRYRQETIHLKRIITLSELKRSSGVDAVETLEKFREQEARAAENSLDFMSWKWLLQEEMQDAGVKLGRSMRGIKDLKRNKETANCLYYALGLVYTADGSLSAAKESFLEAVKYDPRDAESVYNLGLLYSLSRDKADAAKARMYYSKYLELAPHGPRKEAVQDRIAEFDTRKPSKP
jgi:tetratricopeptide (TPR) repeat protein